MQALNMKQWGLVSGGEQEVVPEWDGGGYSADVDYGALSALPDISVEMPTVTITGSVWQGVSTSISDCANGAEVGATFGALAEGIGAAPGAVLGCFVGVGVGILRDLNAP